jgi:hypothetical protein
VKQFYIHARIAEMDVYVLIGKENSGKSSVTRCLTGCRRNGPRVIATSAGSLKVHVELSSLQEKRKTAAALISSVDPTCDAVLLSLRPTGGPVYGGANTYLQQLQRRRGWRIYRVVLLDLPVASITTPLAGNMIALVHGMPHVLPNVIARQIRTRFGWV